MFKKLSLTLLTIILLVAIAGCNVINPTNPESNTSNENSPPGASDDYTEPTANQQMLPLIPGKAADVKLDANADGTTQQLKTGEVLSITLESNPSTGYGWSATISNEKVVVQMGGAQYEEPPSTTGTPMVGAPGTETIFLQAAGAGSATITLDYKRGWEENVLPEKTITITVEVKK